MSHVLIDYRRTTWLIQNNNNIISFGFSHYYNNQKFATTNSDAVLSYILKKILYTGLVHLETERRNEILILRWDKTATLVVVILNLVRVKRIESKVPKRGVCVYLFLAGCLISLVLVKTLWIPPPFLSIFPNSHISYSATSIPCQSFYIDSGVYCFSLKCIFSALVERLR